MNDERPDGSSGQASGMTLAGEEALLTGPSEWTAPRQRTPLENTGQSTPHEVVSVDHRDQTAIFDNSEFQQLRERLFGSAAISSYPVSLRDENAVGDDAEDPFSGPLQLPFPIQVEPPADWHDADLRPTGLQTSVVAEVEASAALVAPTETPDADEIPAPPAVTPPAQPSTIDWATVSPAYAPETEEREARGWLLTALALVVVLAGIGGWLAFGGNNPQAPKSSSLPSTTGTPVAVGSPGLTSEAAVTPNLMVVVSEDVVLENPTSTATFTIPDLRGTNATRTYDPVVNDLEVVVGGEPLDDVDPNLVRGASVTVTFPAEVRAYTITYRASGAINMSKPSKPGRGLALINVIRIAGTDDLPATMTVNGARILSLGCVAPDQPIDDCGTDDVARWIYTGIVGDSLLAQVDLPPV